MKRLTLGMVLGLALAAFAGCGNNNAQCIRVAECVQTCGGPVVASGCAACATGTFDNISCSDGATRDAGTTDVGVAPDTRPADARAD